MRMVDKIDGLKKHQEWTKRRYSWQLLCTSDVHFSSPAIWSLIFQYCIFRYPSCVCWHWWSHWLAYRLSFPSFRRRHTATEAAVNEYDWRYCCRGIFSDVDFVHICCQCTIRVWCYYVLSVFDHTAGLSIRNGTQPVKDPTINWFPVSMATFGNST